MAEETRQTGAGPIGRSIGAWNSLSAEAAKQAISPRSAMDWYAYVPIGYNTASPLGQRPESAWGLRFGRLFKAGMVQTQVTAQGWLRASAH